jgi:hypothetical protein
VDPGEKGKVLPTFPVEFASSTPLDAEITLERRGAARASVVEPLFLLL